MVKFDLHLRWTDTSEHHRHTHTWNLEEFCFEIKEKKINYNVIKISFRDPAL